MPRKPSRFVKDISAEEVKRLRHFMEFGKTLRLRHRAHAVLLSSQRKSVNEIAQIFDVDRDTVSNWLDRFEHDGVDGLADKPRPGAKPKLGQEDKALLLELWEKHGRNPHRVLHEFNMNSSTEISLSTLRRLVRESTKQTVARGAMPRKPR